MTTFKTTHFIPSKHQPQILSSPVTRILAVAHEQQADTNHWCFYFQTSPETSICLDCQPSYSVPSTVIQGGSRANPIISELPYLLPPDAQAHFALDVVPGLTVAGVYDRLAECGLHKYEFDSKGLGCRFWVTEQMDLLLGPGVVTDEKQVSAAKDGILLLWPDRTPNPLDQGAYYQRRSRSSAAITIANMDKKKLFERYTAFEQPVSRSLLHLASVRGERLGSGHDSILVLAMQCIL